MLEVLFTLALISLVILLCFPLYGNTAQQKEIELFFQQFEEDFFYAQQLALVESTNLDLLFYPVQGYYVVGYRYGSNLFRRNLPKGVTVTTNFSINTLRLNRNGHINQGGRVRFEYQKQQQTHSRSYVFQVATGRFRVEDLP